MSHGHEVSHDRAGRLLNSVPLGLQALRGELRVSNRAHLPSIQLIMTNEASQKPNVVSNSVPY